MEQLPRQIDLPLFLGSFVIILAVSRVLSHILPLDVYFSFRDFLLQEDNKYKYLSLTIKLAIPFGSGALATLIFGRLLSRSFDGRVQFYATVRQTYSTSLFIGAAFAAMFQAWPQIAYWDIFADPFVLDYKIQFFAAYGLYSLSFGYFSLAGGLLCISVLQGRGADLYFPGRDTLTKFGTIARNGILGVVASGLGTAIIAHVSGR